MHDSKKVQVIKLSGKCGYKSKLMSGQQTVISKAFPKEPNIEKTKKTSKRSHP